MSAHNLNASHYDVLGVAKDADQPTIKAAFRSLSKATHPDAGGNATLFSAVNEAYRVLSDPTARAVYDYDLRQGGRAQATYDEPTTAEPTTRSYDRASSQPGGDPAANSAASTGRGPAGARGYAGARPADAPAPGGPRSRTPQVTPAQRRRLRLGGLAVVAVACVGALGRLTGATAAVLGVETNTQLAFGLWWNGPPVISVPGAAGIAAVMYVVGYLLASHFLERSRGWFPQIEQRILVGVVVTLVLAGEFLLRGRWPMLAFLAAVVLYRRRVKRLREARRSYGRRRPNPTGLAAVVDRALRFARRALGAAFASRRRGAGNVPARND